MQIELYRLNKTLRIFLTAYLIVLTIGVGVGLIFLMHTTESSTKGAVERWNGSQENSEEEFIIPESYPKPISEMLITTHNHIFGFAFIFVSIGFIFYFNTIMKGFWKTFLMVEPFISTIVTFGSIWLMRFVNESFVYVVVISTVLMYICYFFMLAISLFELNFKKN
jgi:hypothetical protein